MAILKYGQAIQHGLIEEMERDENVFLIGEDIGVYGGAFGITTGLLDRFGPTRIIETPISELGFVGMSVGAALLGSRPVIEIMFMDFITLAMDPIVNHATKFQYMYNDQVKVPLVIRAPFGAGRGYGPTHSQSLEAWFMSVPSISIVAPSTPSDAKGLIKSSIRHDAPVLFLENKLLYHQKGEVADIPSDHCIPLGKANILSSGHDITLVTYARMTHVAKAAAEQLEKENISVEIIDLRTLKPWDEALVLESVQKTGRLLFLEEGPRKGGIGAEICSTIVECSPRAIKISRLGFPDMPVPCSGPLEQSLLPNVEKVIECACRLMS